MTTYPLLGLAPLLVVVIIGWAVAAAVIGEWRARRRAQEAGDAG